MATRAMRSVRDPNGQIVRREIRRDGPDGSWGVNVWFGGALNGFTTTVRRYYYRTQEQARNGDISDDIGRHGRVA
jgi:hypothetical protein